MEVDIAPGELASSERSFIEEQQQRQNEEEEEEKGGSSEHKLTYFALNILGQAAKLIAPVAIVAAIITVLAVVSVLAYLLLYLFYIPTVRATYDVYFYHSYGLQTTFTNLDMAYRQLLRLNFQGQI
jgi:hypothetical protein